MFNDSCYARCSTGEYIEAESVQAAFMNFAERASDVSDSVKFGPFCEMYGRSKKVEDLSKVVVLQGQQLQETQQVMMVTIRLHVCIDLQKFYCYDVGSIKLQVSQMVWRDWRERWTHCRA